MVLLRPRFGLTTLLGAMEDLPEAERRALEKELLEEMAEARRR
jgi:hypothetical protein